MADKTSKQSKGKKNKWGKSIAFGSLGLLIPVLLLYLFLSYYYNGHFYNNTMINGVDTSNMTSEQVEDAINAQAKSYILTLEGRNDLKDQIYGVDIGLHTVYDSSIKDLLEKQNGFLWPISISKTNEMQVKTMLAYDDSLLDKIINKLDYFDEENIVEPVDAYISEYGENGYEIIPEDPGAKVSKDKLKTVVENAINSLETSLSLDEAGCYEEAELKTDSPILNGTLNTLNKIAGAAITYEFGEDTEVLDGKQISKWLSVDKKYNVNIDENGIKEYVDYIGKNYNSFGRLRTFKTSYGDVIKVKGGDYGWWLNRTKEVSELKELILNGESLIKQPAYYQTAQQYGDDDIGDTYVEVNLTAQHLFFYKEGSLILETDFVSGNLSRNFGTPTGTYPIQYKENDATLNGEDYSTPVKYWMPFNGNVGFHDASWRSTFGKDIYLTNGSHGCINMPPAAAKKMFENISKGVAVIVYELEGTESYDKDKDKEKTQENIVDDNNDGNKQAEDTTSE